MRSKSYKSLRSASATIKGMETIDALYKKHRREGNLFGFSALTEVTNLLAA
jgi:putative transposase